MRAARWLRWMVAAVAIFLAVAWVFVAVVGWNWLRTPIERITLERTGRHLVIEGDLELRFGWFEPRLHAGIVRFANPAWAREKQMLTADAVDLAIDLAQLLRLQVVVSDLRLERPVIFLEQGSAGRKNWLLDTEQQDDSARIRIGRLRLDHGTLGYDDDARKTRIQAELSTTDSPSGASGVSFSAQGIYRGMPLQASGRGGPVLALRDENIPYPLQVELRIGQTRLKADGLITSLLRFTALDMRLALSGQSLAQLFPLLGMVFPETHLYSTEGRLVHYDQSWRYQDFTGRIGTSDIAGNLQVDTGAKRPVLNAVLLSNLLDLADLGPVIGARPGPLDAARKVPEAAQTGASTRVLPEMPFKTERWGSVDAQVSLKAKALRGVGALPLADLSTHLSLNDSVLTLDPLDLGLAGGHLAGSIVLDGRQPPIRARVQLRAEKIQLARLFPSTETSPTGIGQINGNFDLTGRGDSVRQMLASSDGQVGLVVAGGQISRLTMERAGLHLWEIVELNLSGDKLVKLRCAIADFDVKAGVMNSKALVFDTEVTTLLGTGRIDLGQERLDLTFSQNTKNTSPLALRSPLHLRGSFAQPEVGVDRGPVAARALGAVALAVINPLLALIPLVDPGPGHDSDCGQLLRAARAMPGVGKISSPGLQKSGGS